MDGDGARERDDREMRVGEEEDEEGEEEEGQRWADGRRADEPLRGAHQERLPPRLFTVAEQRLVAINNSSYSTTRSLAPSPYTTTPTLAEKCHRRR